MTGDILAVYMYVEIKIKVMVQFNIGVMSIARCTSGKFIYALYVCW